LTWFPFRRHGIVWIQIAVLSKSIFKKEDDSGAFISSDAFVRLDGYEFRYVLEEDDYVPDEAKFDVFDSFTKVEPDLTLVRIFFKI